jgi:putative spermidine/putrescine transport system substrate-binding protein
MAEQRPTSGPSRRQVLKGMGLVLASGLAAPAIAQSKPEHLVVSDGGGLLSDAMRVAFYDTFAEKTGIKIITAPFTQLAKLQSMIEANDAGVDVIEADAGDAGVAAKRGWLVPIDWSLLDRKSFIPGVAYDDFILSEVAALVLSWNTQALPSGPNPRDWSALLDFENNPGKRGLYKRAAQTLEVALLASGVEPSKLYPLDVDRALDTLSKIRDQLILWEHGAQSAEILISGEISLGSAWNGRVFQPKKDGAPVDFKYDGALLTAGAWMLPKSGKNTKWAMEFLAHVHQPENQAIFAQHIVYGPVVAAAYDLLPAERRAELPDPSKGVWQDYNYWAEHQDAITAKFNDWMLG